jgi:hypothetical protein
MSINVVPNMATIRTHPRIMRRQSDPKLIGMALHDHEREAAFVWLTGPDAGRLVPSASVPWGDLEDVPGSITIWNTN